MDWAMYIVDHFFTNSAGHPDHEFHICKYVHFYLNNEEMSQGCEEGGLEGKLAGQLRTEEEATKLGG
jgi:hypothetical protein